MHGRAENTCSLGDYGKLN